MNIKVQLAELCANRSMPMESFKKLPAFAILENEPTIIAELEAFRLPEITKLICGSNTLLVHAWAIKYAKIAPLYQTSTAIDPAKVIDYSRTFESFEKEILFFADLGMLLAFESYFTKYQTEAKKVSTEKAQIKKKMTAAKSTVAGEGSNAELKGITELEKRYELLDAEGKKLSAFLKKYKPHIEAVHRYKEQYAEIDSDSNRELAYQKLNHIGKTTEEDFLNRFIAAGTVTEEDRLLFRDQTFISKLLHYMESGVLQNYAIPILLKLYEEGVIDLVEGPASQFLSLHPDRLCDYLIEETAILAEYIDNPDREVLIDKALQNTIDSFDGKTPSVFAKFWNMIEDTSAWRRIIGQLMTLVDADEINQAVSSLMFGLHGKAAKALVGTLSEYDNAETKFSMIEAIALLFERNAYTEKELFLGAMRNYELDNRKIRRRLNTAERKMRSVGQELFSSIYTPMEQLEELAINLKLTNGEIRARLVASQIIDIVMSLREGLATMGVEPLAEVDDWKKQIDVPYDPSIHRLTTHIAVAPTTVKVRTIGFRYIDDEGNWNCHHAHASKEMRKGYPKYEKPGAKSNKESGQITKGRKVFTSAKKDHHSTNKAQRRSIKKK